MGGVVSTSPELHKVWHIGGWYFESLMQEAIRLHRDDPEVNNLFQSAIAIGGLHFYFYDEDVAKRAMAALIEAAKAVLEPSTRNLLGWYLGQPEPFQDELRRAVGDLLALLESECGRERVAVVSVSDENEWVVPHWIFARLLNYAMRLHASNPELAKLLEMAVAMSALRFNRENTDVAKAEIAAILETVRTTLEDSSRDTLNWHVGLDDERQQAYLAEVVSLRDFLEIERRRLDEPPPSAGPTATPEERAALIEVITNIWRAGRPAATDEQERNGGEKG